MTAIRIVWVVAAAVTMLGFLGACVPVTQKLDAYTGTTPEQRCAAYIVAVEPLLAKVAAGHGLTDYEQSIVTAFNLLQCKVPPTPAPSAP